MTIDQFHLFLCCRIGFKIFRHLILQEPYFTTSSYGTEGIQCRPEAEKEAYGNECGGGQGEYGCVVVFIGMVVVDLV